MALADKSTWQYNINQPQWLVNQIIVRTAVLCVTSIYKKNNWINHGHYLERYTSLAPNTDIWVKSNIPREISYTFRNFIHMCMSEISDLTLFVVP